MNIHNKCIKPRSTDDPKNGGIPAVAIMRTNLHLLLYSLTGSKNERGGNACTTTSHAMGKRIILLHEKMIETSFMPINTKIIVRVTDVKHYNIYSDV